MIIVTIYIGLLKFNFYIYIINLLKKKKKKKKKNQQISLRKKRKSVSTTTTVNHYIALGTELGDIEIYSLTHGDIIKRLQGGHNSKVVDFVFSENAKKGYSIGTDGYVVEWDINNGMEMK